MMRAKSAVVMFSIMVPGICAAPAVAALSLVGDFYALETDNSVAAGFPAAGHFQADISASDLIHKTAASLSSVARDKNPFFGAGEINDGLGHASTGSTAKNGEFMPGVWGSGTKMPFTYTFNLNTAPAPEGYRIDSITSFAGWNQNGAALANQKYELWVSVVGDSAFTLIDTIAYTPIAAADTQEAGSSRLTVTQDGGPIATNVDAIRFVFLNHGVNNADVTNSTIDGTVYHEIDVVGQPAPEPGTALLAMAALALCARRRRG